MNHPRNQIFCTNPAWEGRADCRQCPIRDDVLFSKVPDAVLDRVLVPIKNQRYEPKSVIYSLGDPGRAIFTIRRGAMKLTQTLSDGTSRVVRVLIAGDLLGLEALLDRPYAHTATALHGVDLCRIPVEVIHKLNAGLSPVYDELLKRWQRNLDQADAFIAQLSTGTSHARMARLLLFLDGHAGMLGTCPLNREDMGQILGVSTETASRIVAEFKRLNILAERGGLLHHIDVDALKRIAATA